MQETQQYIQGTPTTTTAGRFEPSPPDFIGRTAKGEYVGVWERITRRHRAYFRVVIKRSDGTVEKFNLYINDRTKIKPTPDVAASP